MKKEKIEFNHDADSLSKGIGITNKRVDEIHRFMAALGAKLVTGKYDKTELAEQIYEELDAKEILWLATMFVCDSTDKFLDLIDVKGILGKLKGKIETFKKQHGIPTDDDDDDMHTSDFENEEEDDDYNSNNVK